MRETKQTRSATVDMTAGSPVRLILAFTIPLLLGQLFQQVYSLSDTMIAGYVLGENALAAIGATGSLYNLMIGFSMGLSNGCGMVLGKLFGAHDMPRFRKASAIMLLFNLGIGILLTVLTTTFSTPLMQLVNTPESIFAQAQSYMVVIFGGLFVTIVYNMCAGFMRALGNSRMPLYFLIAACVLNLLLDVLLMIVFRAGVAGAAWATVIAQGLSAAASMGYIWKHMRAYLPGKSDFVPETKIMLDMTATGLSMALMASVVNVGSVIMTSSVNALGEIAITADTTARRLFGMMSAPMSNLGLAGAAFTSQNFGAGQYPRCRRGVKTIALMEAAWAAVAMTLMLIFAELVVRLVTGTDNGEIIRLGAKNLRIGAILYVPLSFLLCIRQMMQTLGMHIIPVFSSAIELLMKIGCALWIVPTYGYDGACWGEPSTWLACAAFLGTIYLIRRRGLFPDLRQARAR